MLSSFRTLPSGEFHIGFLLEKNPSLKYLRTLRIVSQAHDECYDRLLLDGHTGTCAVWIIDEGFISDYRPRQYLLVRRSVRNALLALSRGQINLPMPFTFTDPM